MEVGVVGGVWADGFIGKLGSLCGEDNLDQNRWDG